MAWLWMAGPPEHWFVHLSQFVLLAVPLFLFAVQTLQESGAFASRRAHQLMQRVLDRKEWPAELEECRTLPDVKALRESLSPLPPTPMQAMLMRSFAPAPRRK